MGTLTALSLTLLLSINLSLVYSHFAAGKHECYIVNGLLQFDLQINRNGSEFTRIYFVNSSRDEMNAADCPTLHTNAAQDQYNASFFVNTTTDQISDGKSCGLEVLNATSNEYIIRIETEIEFERDRHGDIQFAFKCTEAGAAKDVVSTILTKRDPDIVRPPVPTEVIFLQAVTVSGANLPTVLVGSENIPTIGIGEYFALQLNFVTSSTSSAKGASCKKLYASWNSQFTRKDHLIDETTSCPAGPFLPPAHGLRRIGSGSPYVYRTGQIEAAKYDPRDFPQATDLVHFACEAVFCRRENDPACDDPCPSRKKRDVEILDEDEFRDLVKRSSEELITLDIKITKDEEGASSMVVVWASVGVSCLILVVLVIAVVLLCLARNKPQLRKNAYKHHVDASSLTSSVEKIRY